MRLQPLVRARVASLGEAGAAWVASLPRLLAELEDRWDVRVGPALAGGSASYVVRATTSSGEARVLKVCVPDPSLGTEGDDEARTLAAADGRGYVRLHGWDPARRALLMESLGPPLGMSGLPPTGQLEVLAATLAEAWTVPVETASAPAPGDDKASRLHALVTECAVGQSVSSAVLDQALRYAERLAAAYSADECVLVHGDAHPYNTVAVTSARPGAPAGHVLVDPDGFRAEPAYDLGVALRDWSRSLTGDDAATVLRGWCDLLSARTGQDPQRIWEWAFLERVSTGLYVLSFGGSEAVARPFLTTAERLLD